MKPQDKEILVDLAEQYIKVGGAIGSIVEEVKLRIKARIRLNKRRVKGNIHHRINLTGEDHNQQETQ